MSLPHCMRGLVRGCDCSVKVQAGRLIQTVRRWLLVVNICWRAGAGKGTLYENACTLNYTASSYYTLW